MQFDAAGNPPVTTIPGSNPPITVPVTRNLCFLPADAELSARADMRRYFSALMTAGNNGAVIDAAGLAGTSTRTFPFLACNRPRGATCTARAAVNNPFRLLTAAGTASVNLCTKTFTFASGITKQGCPANANFPEANFHNAVATSWFKMSKWYGINGVNQGTAWGVAPQPCQVGQFATFRLLVFSKL